MKRIISIVAVALVALGISSCNIKIENPTARNFIGTWDLVSTEIVAPNGSVTTTPSNSMDYLIITENTISYYEADKITNHYSFGVKDNKVFVDGTARYDIESFATREMTLTQDGFGLLVSKYKYHYKKR